MKYDIFISCKSEDYSLATPVYQFLVDNGLSVFFSPVVLRKVAKSEYGEIIDYALDCAKHMIVFASNPKYLYSSYVRSEWRTFVEEQRSNRKSGNIITILKDVEVSALPIGLRIFQSFVYEEYESILDYLTEPKEVVDSSSNDSQSSTIPSKQDVTDGDVVKKQTIDPSITTITTQDSSKSRKAILSDSVQKIIHSFDKGWFARYKAWATKHHTFHLIICFALFILCALVFVSAGLIGEEWSTLSIIDWIVGVVSFFCMMVTLFVFETC